MEISSNEDDEAIKAEDKERLYATRIQIEQPSSTKYEPDTGTHNTKEYVEKDKKAENNETGEDKDKDKTIDERKTVLPTTTQPLDELAFRLEPGIVPHDRKRQEHNALEDINLGDDIKLTGSIIRMQ